MNCLIRIRQRYPDLAQSDKKLADYLLSQPDTARHLSSQQLAAEAGVSQSSVVKFAQKMGFKRWPAIPTPIPFRYIIRFAVTILCVWWGKS